MFSRRLPSPTYIAAQLSIASDNSLSSRPSSTAIFASLRCSELSAIVCAGGGGEDGDRRAACAAAMRLRESLGIGTLERARPVIRGAVSPLFIYSAPAWDQIQVSRAVEQRSAGTSARQRCSRAASQEETTNWLDRRYFRSYCSNAIKDSGEISWPGTLRKYLARGIPYGPEIRRIFEI